MHRMLSAATSADIAAFNSLLILLNTPFSWAVSEYHAKKKESALLDKQKTTNVRHQTQTRFCRFLAVTHFFVSLG